MTDNNIINLDNFPDLPIDDIDCNKCKTKICNECSLKYGIRLGLWISETEEEKQEIERYRDICNNCKTKICNECSLEVYGIKLRLWDPETKEEKK